MFCSASLFAQQSGLLERKVTVQFSNTSIEEILKSLETSDLSFVYSPEVFDVKKRVSINRQQATVRSVLAELFAGQSMESYEMNGQVLLRKKRIPKEAEPEKAKVVANPDTTKSEAKTKVLEESSIEPDTSSTKSKGTAMLEVSETTSSTVMTTSDIDSLQKQVPAAGLGSGNGQGEQIVDSSSRQFYYTADLKVYHFPVYKIAPYQLDYTPMKPRYQIPEQETVWDKYATDNKKAKRKKTKEAKTPGDKKFRFGIASYTGYTELNNTPSILLGGRVMFYAKPNLAIGLSGNAFLSDSFFNSVANMNIELEGGYGGLALEYVLFPKSVVHLNIPIMIGAGGYTYHEAGTIRNPAQWENQKAFFVLEAGLELEVNVTSFMKIGFGMGYRDVAGSGLLNQNSEEVIPESSLESLNYGLVLKFGRF